MIGYSQFKKDSKYLLKNNLLRIILLVGALSACGFFLKTDLSKLAWFLVPILLISLASTKTTGAGFALGAGILYFQEQQFSPYYLSYVLVAVVTTFPITALYHSASHSSMRPHWLNRIVGEIIGFWHMSSLDEWSIIHAFHHAHSDDLENDPHPPAGQSFLQFMKSTAKNIGASFAKHFIKIHGTESSKNFKVIFKLILLRQFLLSTLWFVILGPELYVYLFATNIVFKKVHYAWFNWATHVTVNNKVEVVNLDKGLYWIINRIAFNLYLHGSHHHRPKAFMPQALPTEKTPISAKVA